MFNWRFLNSSNNGSMEAINSMNRWKIKEAAVSSDGFINEKDMNMMTIMYLVRQTKLQKVNANKHFSDTDGALKS